MTGTFQIKGEFELFVQVILVEIVSKLNVSENVLSVKVRESMLNDNFVNIDYKNEWESRI